MQKFLPNWHVFSFRLDAKNVDVVGIKKEKTHEYYAFGIDKFHDKDCVQKMFNILKNIPLNER